MVRMGRRESYNSMRWIMSSVPIAFGVWVLRLSALRGFGAVDDFYAREDMWADLLRGALPIPSNLVGVSAIAYWMAYTALVGVLILCAAGVIRFAFTAGGRARQKPHSVVQSMLTLIGCAIGIEVLVDVFAERIVDSKAVSWTAGFGIVVLSALAWDRLNNTYPPQRYAVVAGICAAAVAPAIRWFNGIQRSIVLIIDLAVRPMLPLYSIVLLVSAVLISAVLISRASSRRSVPMVASVMSLVAFSWLLLAVSGYEIWPLRIDEPPLYWYSQDWAASTLAPALVYALAVESIRVIYNLKIETWTRRGSSRSLQLGD